MKNFETFLNESKQSEDIDNLKKLYSYLYMYLKSYESILILMNKDKFIYDIVNNMNSNYLGLYEDGFENIGIKHWVDGAMSDIEILLKKFGTIVLEPKIDNYNGIKSVCNHFQQAHSNINIIWHKISNSNNKDVDKFECGLGDDFPYNCSFDEVRISDWSDNVNSLYDIIKTYGFLLNVDDDEFYTKRIRDILTKYATPTLIKNMSSNEHQLRFVMIYKDNREMLEWYFNLADVTPSVSVEYTGIEDMDLYFDANELGLL